MAAQTGTMTAKQKARAIKALKKAIDYYGESKNAFGRALGINPSAVYHWLSGRVPISIRLACKIEDLVDGHVSVSDLVPNLSDKLHNRTLQ